MNLKRKEEIIISVATTVVIFVVIAIVWIVMTAFNMSYAVYTVCANTPKIVTKVISNRDRYLYLLKRYTPK